ncbi:MAG: OmpP1/FadL family transporter [Thiotrichales bacterium]
MIPKLHRYAATALAIGGSLTTANVFATNGMSMEAYGARSGGMGGAAMAFDAGNSAVMSNPATLSLIKDGSRRLGVGLTILGPDVTSTGPAAFGSPSTDSDGTAYYMPSASFMTRSGNYTYGIAMLAQGGMGTEYGKAGPGDLFFAGQTAFGATDPDGLGTGVAMLSGREVRSEVGFGRLMAPLAFKVNKQLSIAGQIDFVWATMDMQMDVDGATFADMAFGSNPNVDYGSASGTMIDAFGGATQAGMVTDVSWARFDWSDNSDFSGDASGYGLAGKLGVHYVVDDKLSIGAAYHTKTAISDLESSSATISFDGSGMAFGGGAIDVTGKVDVIDFQWPATLGFGGAYKVNDQWMIAGDIRQLFWSDVMAEFKVKFTADAVQANPAAAGFAGTDVTASFTQDWDDQTVISLGGQYKPTDKLALRAGANLASNPVPDQYLNALFPAITENHFTAGVGYAFSPASKVGFAVSVAPEVEQTNSQNNVTSTHSQTTFRFNYVHEF